MVGFNNKTHEIRMFIFMILAYRIIEIATKMYVLQGKVSILLFHRDMEP